MQIEKTIEAITGWWDGLIPYKKQCDGLKWGRMDQECSGILVCWQATSQALQKAKNLNLNLVLTHEEPFWYETGVLYAGSPEIVFEEKKGNKPRLAICREFDPVIYRTHDFLDMWHEHGIVDQWIKFLDWPIPLDSHPVAKVVTLPKPQSARELASYVAGKHSLSSVQIAGDPNRVVNKVGVLVGGFAWVPTIDLLLPCEPDVILAGEIREPDGLQYLYELDLPCITIGHAVSEEPGLKHFAGYLAEQFSTSVHFHHNKDLRETVLAGG